MNYGRFFSLDTEASQLINGVTVFNYRGLKNKSACILHENIRDKYPVYVSFSQEKVSFHVHNIEESEEDGVISTEQHTNSLVLSLPISANLEIKDNLTENIINIFKNKYPYNETSNKIYQYAAESAQSSETAGKGITYSSLEVFGIIYDRPLKIECPPIVGFLRKLFLDFLFDLEHCTVFKNAINFEAIYIALNENFLFKAIKDKAEYYYQRKMVSGQEELNLSSSNIVDKGIFLADFYVAAEKRWVETITNKRAESMFHRASGWFQEVEKEMNAVYISGYLKYEHFEHPHITWRSIDFVKKIVPEKSCNSENKAYNEKCIASLKSSIVDTAKAASNWYIHKYSFEGILAIWFGKSYLAWAWALVSVLTLLVVGIIQPLPIAFWGFNEFSLASYVIILLVTLKSILIGIDYIRGVGIQTVGSVNILMPRLFAAIITSWFTLAIGEDVFKGFFDSIFSLKASFMLATITFLFVIYEIRKLNPYIKCCNVIKRSLILIGVAFLYSFATGLLVVSFFGGRYLERSDYVDEFYTNNIYIESPNYTIAADSVQAYVNNNFYKVLAKYDTSLIKSIDTTPIHYDPKLPANTIEYLKKKAGTLEYGVLVKLLSVFNAKDSLSRQNIEMIAELYQHMMEGSLISYRIGKVKDFVAKNDSILITFADIASLNISSDSNGGIIDKNWIEILKSINNHRIYRETLRYLIPVKTNYYYTERRPLVTEFCELSIFRELLLQFTFFAMFIGIFLQLIFEEKPVTEPI